MTTPPRLTCPHCSGALPRADLPACPHCGQRLDAGGHPPAVPYSMPAVSDPPPASADRSASARQVEYEHPTQLRAALALIVPGETLVAVLPTGRDASAYVAFTDRRLIFLDQGPPGSERRVVSLSYSHLTFLAFAAAEGTAFATTRLVIQADVHQWTFDFSSVAQAHRAYHLISGNLLPPESRRDLTERPAAEPVRSETEEQLFQFLEAVPLGLAMFDSAGRPQYVNKAALRIMGQGLDPRVPIGDVPQVYQVYLAGTDQIYPAERRPTLRALAGEVSTVDDMEIHQPERVFPLQVWGAPIFDAAGHVVYTIAALADISERKEREAALRAAHERFAQAFRAIPDVLAISRLTDGRVIEANSRWLAVFGYHPEEVIGHTALELNLWPDPRSRAALRAAVAEHRAVHDQEMILRHRSGALRDVQVSVEVFEIEQEAHALTIIRDITERKATEAELRLRSQQQELLAALSQQALTAAAFDLLLGETASRAATGLDAEFAALSELTPDGQTLVLRAVVGWPAELVGTTQIAVDRTTQAGATVLTNQPLLLDEAHPQVDFGISAYVRERGAISALSVVIPGPSHPFGVLVVHSKRRRTFNPHDIQFLQSLANVLATAVERDRHLAARVARDAAEQANRAKSEFLSRISHELRTPLNAILGFGELLELTPLPPRQQESVGQILKAGQHLLNLINEVLDISRIETGQLKLSIEPVLLRDVLQESLALVQPSAAQRQIQFHTPDFTQTTLYVLADHQRLKQVLLNLFSNAIKYNRAGGVVYMVWEVMPAERLRLRVRDTGRGLPPERIEQLFQPFERLGAEATDVLGTGLGLVLSRDLMEAMDGQLGLERTSSEGSTFWLEIPLATAAPMAAHIAEIAPPLAPVTVLARTVLLIDDNPANLRLVQRILELRPSVTLLAAQQGRQGLDLAQAHRPDLILLDLQLPDLSGEKVLQRLRDDPATAAIPVVIFSADATPGQPARLRAAGATDYLTKPFRVATFLARIDQLLQPGNGPAE